MFAECDQSIRTHIGEPDVRHGGGRFEPRELRRSAQRDLAAGDFGLQQRIEMDYVR